MITEWKLKLDEIKELSKKMVILVDSREKQNRHILDYFDKQRIAYQVQGLSYGDYSFYLPAGAMQSFQTDAYFHREIVIERKASLEELSGNIGKERERFEKEMGKAHQDRCKMYLFIENPRGYSDIMEHNYKTEFKPVQYVTSLKSFENRYGVNIQFIDPKYTGYLLYSTFYYYIRERMC